MRDRLMRLCEPWIGEDVPEKHVAGAMQLAVKSPSIAFDFAQGVENGEGRLCGPDSLFDIASLTKPFVATAALIAVDRALISFDDKLSSYFPRFKGGATVLHLLNHSSGLAAWDKFYERKILFPTTLQAATQREDILSETLESPLRPAGEASLYSDLGYMLLGHLLERCFSKDLDDIIADEIAQPLGLGSLRFVNQIKGEGPICSVQTEINPLRKGVVQGVVHDENCFIQGGVCGHAGLFSNAKDVLRFGDHIRACLDEKAKGIVSEDTIRFAISKRAMAPTGHYYAGWDMPSGEKSSVGSYFSKSKSFGHLGFTGTSLWIDREKKLVVVLFTNRVFPTRENKNILSFRIAIHDAIAGAFT